MSKSLKKPVGKNVKSKKPTTKTVRTNEQLWQKIKTKIHEGSKGGAAGTWNARKAQLAVLEYKKQGGGYIGEKSTHNSLVKWTNEKWGYIDGKKGNRYLPEHVRNRLTEEQKKTENTAKQKATKNGQRYAKYSPVVVKLMKNKN